MAVVVGVFENYAAAQASVQDLIAHDFSGEAISVVGRRGDDADPPPAEVDTTGTAIGVGTGAVLGGTLAAMGLAVPGIGWLIAAGPLAAALAGASIGAAAGGVIGVLVDVGIPSAEAEQYAQAVKKGATLVTVTADESRADAAVEILARHHAVDVEEREEAPGAPESRLARQEGPATTSDVRRERDRLHARDVRAARRRGDVHGPDRGRRRPDAGPFSRRPASARRVRHRRRG